MKSPFDAEGDQQFPLIVSLPHSGETLVISGKRKVPLVIRIDREAEDDPQRDADVLCSALLGSLPTETLWYLYQRMLERFASGLESIRGKVDRMDGDSGRAGPSPPDNPFSVD